MLIPLLKKHSQSKLSRAQGMIRRLPNALYHALQGLYFTWRNENSFRLELIILLTAIIILQYCHVPWKHQFLLLGSIVLIIILELQNTAIEKLSDRVTRELDDTIKTVKDCSSAAVFVATVGSGILWFVYFCHKFGYL